MDDQPLNAQSGNHNSRYALVGVLLLLLGGGGLYMMLKGSGTPQPLPPPPPAARDAGPPQPLTPQVGATIELPPEEPDAGPAPDAGPPRIRYVTRYVNECSGTLSDPAAVARTAQSNYGALRACYEHELRANPQLRGRLVANLKIGTNGHLSDVSVQTAMNSHPLVDCVKRSLMRVVFPPARGGCAIYQASFNFSPRE